MYLLRVLAICALFFPSIVEAKELHAFAMHGEPLYSADAKSFDYANPNAPKGGALRLAKGGTFNNLNSLIISGDKVEGLTLINSKLMQRAWNEPFTMYGLVASSVEVSDDRSEVIFHLNKNAKFHDGQPITSDDVKFSHEMYMKHGHPVRRRVYGLVDKVELISDTDIKFTFGEGYDQESVLILMLMEVLPKHYWENKAIGKTTLEPPLGSGPYKIKSLQAGREIVYERVKNHWAENALPNVGHYNFDTITYSYYRDDDVALESFKAGEYDVRNEYDIGKWKNSYDVRSNPIVKKDIHHGRPEWVRAMIFNTRKSTFKDIRVRKALSMMFEFEWINKSFFFSEYKQIYSTFPNSKLAASAIPIGAELDVLNKYKDELSPDVFGEAWKPYTGNMRARKKQAVALLSEAGWEYKGQKLVNANTGAPFTFELLLSNSGDEKLALFYINTLKKLGIDVTVRTVDSVQFTGRLSEFDYDMVVYRWINSLSPGAEQMNYWGQDAAKTKGSRNYAGVDIKAVDDIAFSIANSKTRKDLEVRTHALDRILMHGHYFIPLYYSGKDMIATQSYIAMPEITPVYGAVKEVWWQAE